MPDLHLISEINDINNITEHNIHSIYTLQCVQYHEGIDLINVVQLANNSKGENPEMITRAQLLELLKNNTKVYTIYDGHKDEVVLDYVGPNSPAACIKIKPDGKFSDDLAYLPRMR